MGGNEITFTRNRSTDINGTMDLQTGRIRELLLVNLSTLQIQGDFSPRDLERLQQQLAATAGSDTSATRDDIAARADAADPTTSTNPNAGADPTTSTNANTGADPQTATDGALRPPEGYAQGRYTEATTDGDVREGFRGERVRAVQQRLVDEGFLTGENAVDGYWGPQTQAAYERSQAAGRDNNTRQLTEDIQNGDSEAITRRLTNANNAEMRELDRRLPRNGDGSYSTRLANVAGDDSDFAEFSNLQLRGRRNEGAAARADAGVIDDFQERILRARVSPTMRDLGMTGSIGTRWNGTDERAINEVFASASSEQLRALDQRIRSGVRDENGDTVRFSDGLAGLIRSEIGAGAHRDALLAQLNRE